MNCSPLGSFHLWNFPGKNAGVDCHLLFQEIFPTQGLNTGLLHCRQILYHLSHQGLSSVDMTISQVHPCYCRWHCCILFSGWVLFLCIYVPHLPYPSVNGHLSWFHVLAIINSARETIIQKDTRTPKFITALFFSTFFFTPHFFLILIYILLSMCITVYLSIHLLKDILIASKFGQL